MELSPQQVRAMSFSTVKRGYDATEVNSFIAEVAVALESAQNETRAMEARARAAVARLQELAQGGGDVPEAATGVAGAETDQSREISASVDETETISRTLLLAQRTADTTVAEADAEAERILAEARDSAAQSLDQARSMADQLVEEAKVEARREGEGERTRVEEEVRALGNHRGLLESDVDTLEGFLIEQRERLRESATLLTEMVERVPGGLGEMRLPTLSDVVVDDEDTQPYDRPGQAGEELGDDPAGGSIDAEQTPEGLSRQDPAADEAADDGATDGYAALDDDRIGDERRT